MCGNALFVELGFVPEQVLGLSAPPEGVDVRMFQQ